MVHDCNKQTYPVDFNTWLSVTFTNIVYTHEH